MQRFKVGQRIHVEYNGTLAAQGDGMKATIKVDNPPYGDRLYLVNLTEVKITQADPKDWPPQVGDIWEADGREWYAREHSLDDLGIVVESFDHPNGKPSHYQRGTLADFKALNPVLVRRRGQ
jgi:hypothetical protein